MLRGEPGREEGFVHAVPRERVDEGGGIADERDAARGERRPGQPRGQAVAADLRERRGIAPSSVSAAAPLSPSTQGPPHAPGRLPADPAAAAGAPCPAPIKASPSLVQLGEALETAKRDLRRAKEQLSVAHAENDQRSGTIRTLEAELAASRALAEELQARLESVRSALGDEAPEVGLPTAIAGAGPG